MFSGRQHFLQRSTAPVESAGAGLADVGWQSSLLATRGKRDRNRLLLSNVHKVVEREQTPSRAGVLRVVLECWCLYPAYRPHTVLAWAELGEGAGRRWNEGIKPQSDGGFCKAADAELLRHVYVR